MANEIVKKIGELLKSFNEAFELEAVVIDDNSDDPTVTLCIDKLKNNGAEFINQIYETFNTIVQASSKEHEVIYQEGKGLIVAKKVVKQVIKTEFVPENFD